MASPSPVPFPISLVVKNGSKSFQRLLVHAAAVVADSEHHVIPGKTFRVFDAIGLIEGDVLRFDGDLTHAGNGITGIDT